jgi:hypothetical protein
MLHNCRCNGKIVKIIEYTKWEIILWVTLKLNYFKAKISAILKVIVVFLPINGHTSVKHKIPFYFPS